MNEHTVRCPECGKPVAKNLVEKDPDFKCPDPLWRKTRGLR